MTKVGTIITLTIEVDACESKSNLLQPFTPLHEKPTRRYPLVSGDLNGFKYGHLWIWTPVLNVLHWSKGLVNNIHWPRIGNEWTFNEPFHCPGNWRRQRRWRKTESCIPIIIQLEVWFSSEAQRVFWPCRGR